MPSIAATLTETGRNAVKTTASGSVGRSVAPAILSASVFLLCANVALPATGVVHDGLTAVETVLVDNNATGYATFQSHNQKVVSNKNGIFMTHIHSRNESFTAQQWRLSRSTDCIGNSQGKIACLASDDNGATWYDYALSQQTFVPYSIGGCREISADGSILGSFTDQREPPGKVYFIRIKAGLASARILKSNYDRGDFSVQFTDVRGQPENVRLSVDGKTWSDWHAFPTTLNVSLAARPRFFQLRSRIAQESSVRAVPVAARKAM